MDGKLNEHDVKNWRSRFAIFSKRVQNIVGSPFGCTKCNEHNVVIYNINTANTEEDMVNFENRFVKHMITHLDDYTTKNHVNTTIQDEKNIDKAKNGDITGFINTLLLLEKYNEDESQPSQKKHITLIIFLIFLIVLAIFTTLLSYFVFVIWVIIGIIMAYVAYMRYRKDPILTQMYGILLAFAMGPWYGIWVFVKYF